MTTFDEGREAYFNGKTIDECPYDPGSDDAGDWEAGFCDAEDGGSDD